MDDNVIPNRAAVAGDDGKHPEIWRTDCQTLLGMSAYHLLAMLAFTPWFFSWTGVALAIAGIYVFGLLGVNLGYHRLLTHRSFSCPKWLEYTLTILGVCNCQDAPAFWVAVHRRHHQFTDLHEDPHSPRESFVWGHIGWFFLKNDALDPDVVVQRYAKDLMRDRLQVWLQSHWERVIAISWVVFFAGGFGVGVLEGMQTPEALKNGISFVLWGVVVRTVATWHSTSAINSVTHLWGYRNYNTKDGSRNNFFVGLIAHGEGRHNNHHADPNSALHGHKWWEFDLTFLTIRVLRRLGLVKDIVMPSKLNKML